MLFFLVSCVSFFLLSKSLSLPPLPSWASDMRLLSLAFCQELASLLLWWLKNTNLLSFSVFKPLGTLPMISPRKTSRVKVENVESSDELSILDLPDLALESILGRLPPSGLCNMAGVCSSLRDRCRSDHLWERHMKEKWGRVIGQTAYREWQWYVASRKDFSGRIGGPSSRGLFGTLSCMWPLSWIRSSFAGSEKKIYSSLHNDSIMSWYLSLESGKFWFPAQVYNREVYICLVHPK